MMGLATALALLHNPGMAAELTPEEQATITALLRDNINADRFPLSPRVRS